MLACSAYLKTPRKSANTPARIKAASIEIPVEILSASRIAYPPSIVIKAAHKLPIMPIAIASAIKPASGFTSAESLNIMFKLVLFFIAHTPFV